MDKNTNPDAPELTKRSLEFLGKYLKATPDNERKINHENEDVINSALLYEKFRVAVEYQEEHLVFKNAISRIVRRKITLSPNISRDQLVSDLISELSWTNYVNPETIDDKEIEKIKNIVGRYLILLKFSRSGFLSKQELHSRIINWLACEIDDTLAPHPEKDILINYAFSILEKNIKVDNPKISGEENEMQLKLAIYNLVFKPDLPLIQIWVIDKIYPGWRDYSEVETKKFALSFDPNNNAIDRIVNSPYRTKYLQFTKRSIAPFILIKNLPKLGSIDTEMLEKTPSLISKNLLAIYDSLIKSTKSKVWRGTIRALIFILLTKISLALILEVPFDRFIKGEIHYTSLIINVCLPPLLMLFMGLLVKSPSLKNRKALGKTINNIFFEDKIDVKPFSLAPRKLSGADRFFNLSYAIFSISILGLVVWGLLALQFNFLSIVLFFLFVSAVSFFSFRIRTIALELSIKSSKNIDVSSRLELILLPFIRIGKIISDRLTKSNPFTSGLDLLIEAPLKIIIKTVNSWLGFVNRKKEEIEF